MPDQAVKAQASKREPIVSEADRRAELAACYRLIAHFNMSDTIYTHVTARVPEAPDQMLINPYGLLFDEVTASNLVKVDFDGQVLDSSRFPLNAAGFIIHASIYRARSDAGCIIHTHTTAGAALSALGCGLLPISQFAMEFYNRIGYHAFEGLATDQEEGSRIADDLGSFNALIMRNHGLLVVGRSVAAAFETMYYLEQACLVQLAAQNTGATLHLPPAEVCEHAATQFETQGVMPKGKRLWSAMLRKLDRADSGYRK
ncbi:MULTISPECIES: class II aldolase/adducin family protein [unclassified Bradyrhizobium]|uniref:class II aldolase/adducin family protein n=1 Tax=unclassified Bradyrhizobium TaxID=2631580 RepID=UPI0028ED5F16|nr:MULTISPECIES: class II aldolase/adducin family protein [unclassified Bradyrhizobium]